MIECADPNLHAYWSTVIGVAQHFNELLSSTRSLVASVMLAVFGAAIAATIKLKEDKIAKVGRVPMGALILMGGLAFLGCMLWLEYSYYYQLLLRSVEVAQNLEQRCPKNIIDLTIQLSNAVSRRKATTILFSFYGSIAGATLVAIWIVWRWDNAIRGK